MLASYRSLGFVRLSRVLAIACALLGLASLFPPVSYAQWAMWDTYTLIEAEGRPGEPCILEDTDGRLHIFWQQSDGDITPMWYAGIKDNEIVVLDIFVADDITTPCCFLDRTGRLHLIWCETAQLMHASVTASEAADVRAWSTPEMIAMGERLLRHPDVVLDEVGRLHLVYTSVMNSSSHLMYSFSDDDGQSWYPETILESTDMSTVVDRPQMLLGEGTKLYVGWSQVPLPEGYGGVGVYLTESTDRGETWQLPARLDVQRLGDKDLGAWQLGLSTDRQGRFLAVWSAHSQSGARWWQESFDGGATWSAPQSLYGGLMAQCGPDHQLRDDTGAIHVFASGTYSWDYPTGLHHIIRVGNHWEGPYVDYESFLTGPDPHYIDGVITQDGGFHLVWVGLGKYAQPEMWYMRAGAEYIDRLHRLSPSQIDSLQQAEPTLAPTVEPEPAVADYDDLPEMTLTGTGETTAVVLLSTASAFVLFGLASLVLRGRRR